jgi:hypothetical protein
VGAVDLEERLAGPAADPVFERAERLAPRVGARVVPQGEFGGEPQQPRPAVRLLEAGVLVEVGDLAGDVLGCQPPVDAGRDRGLVRVVRREPQRADERPVAVDRRVPVEAAVEGGVILRRARRRVRPLDDPLVMRVLGLDPVERVLGQRRRDRVVERVRSPGAERVR